MPNMFVYVAAVFVAKKETWRRKAIWNRVQDFRTMTRIPITSHIISLIVGSEEQALKASRSLFFLFFVSWCRFFCFSKFFVLLFSSTAFFKWLSWYRHMLKCGFHITAIRPPTVPANLCRFVASMSLCFLAWSLEVGKLAGPATSYGSGLTHRRFLSPFIGFYITTPFSC